MIRSLQCSAWRDWFAVLFVAGQFAVFPLAAEPVTAVPALQKRFPAATNLPPLPAPPKSPVDLFRDLLAMTPDERQNVLTNRLPENRARILAKVHEYAALDPDERELRLRATELRWYLLPLLHRSPANRAPQLAAVPEDLQPLVKSRLAQWDILPPPLQNEFFESERALRYFSHVDPPLPPVPPGQGQHPTLQSNQLSHWNGLPESQRQKITAQFNQFFELTTVEKQKTLKTLSAAERQQMEKTLETFGRLPPAQRLKCIRGFTEFAAMSASEKQDFLNNARRWSQMSPKERQAWRDLVTHVPQWAPLPPNLMPPLPPGRPQLTLHTRPTLATNHN